MLGLLCVDVDGTLVGTDNSVRDDVWAALARARAQGMRVAICSGRPAVGNARAYAERLDPDGWHVFQNGASVVNVGSGRSLSEPFPAELLPGLIGEAERAGLLLELYSDTEYAVTLPGALAQRHAELLGVPYRPLAPAALPGTPVRTQWVVPESEQARAEALTPADLDLHPSTSPVMPGVAFISATRTGVNKGSAVTRVAAAYGLSLDRVMMVGDGENDLSALQVVGFPVAMGNAHPPVKAAARAVVGHVDAGGLCEAVELALRS